MQEKKFYDPIIMLFAAALIVIIPSLMTWKFHILSISDPSVVIGLVCCYLFAAVDVIFGLKFLGECIQSYHANHEMNHNSGWMRKTEYRHVQ